MLRASMGAVSCPSRAKDSKRGREKLISIAQTKIRRCTVVEDVVSRARGARPLYCAHLFFLTYRKFKTDGMSE